MALYIEESSRDKYGRPCLNLGRVGPSGFNHRSKRATCTRFDVIMRPTLSATRCMNRHEKLR